METNTGSRSGISDRLTRLDGDLARIRGADWRRDVTLVAVSKFVEAPRLREAFHLGLRDFGENRSQEFRDKSQQLEDLPLTWHFIGQLQRNKVRDVVGRVALVHSLDRLSLASEMAQAARRQEVIQDVLVQVNTSGEPTKAGFAPEGALAAVEEILEGAGYAGLRVRGFMTIGANTSEESVVRASFRRLRDIRDEAARRPVTDRFLPDILSMGMSLDYRIALEEGSTMVRIGSAIFGSREGAT